MKLHLTRHEKVRQVADDIKLTRLRQVSFVMVIILLFVISEIFRYMDYFRNDMWIWSLYATMFYGLFLPLLIFSTDGSTSFLGDILKGILTVMTKK